MEKHDNSKTQGILSQDSQHMFIHFLMEKYDNSKTQALITRVNILEVTITITLVLRSTSTMNFKQFSKDQVSK